MLMVDLFNHSVHTIAFVPLSKLIELSDSLQSRENNKPYFNKKIYATAASGYVLSHQHQLYFWYIVNMEETKNKN